MLKVLSLPDETRDWQGTAAQLAVRINELLPLAGLESDAGSANERLIRYYVTAGILTEPESHGRERLFGFRQIVEFLIARQLLEDGWPLAKIRELIRSSAGIEGLLQLGAPARNPTAAEQALANIREQAEPSLGALKFQYSRIEADPSPEANSYSAVRPSGERLASPMRTFEEPPRASLSSITSLERAADLSLRRSQLRDDLKTLGNPSGRPHRRKVLRLSLTPWCQVQIDMQALKSMDATTPQILGDSLARALEEERMNSGEK